LLSFKVRITGDSAPTGDSHQARRLHRARNFRTK